MSLRYVDPYAERSWLYRVHGRLVCTRLFQLLALTSVWAAVVWRIDRLLLRLTGGRPCPAPPAVTALLETSWGLPARPRRTRVDMFPHGAPAPALAPNPP